MKSSHFFSVCVFVLLRQTHQNTCVMLIWWKVISGVKLIAGPSVADIVIAVLKNTMKS